MNPYTYCTVYTVHVHHVSTLGPIIQSVEYDVCILCNDTHAAVGRRARSCFDPLKELSSEEYTDTAPLCTLKLPRYIA